MPDNVSVGTAVLNYEVNNRRAVQAVEANRRALLRLRTAQRRVENLVLRVTTGQTANQISSITRATQAQARASQQAAAAQRSGVSAIEAQRRATENQQRAVERAHTAANRLRNRERAQVEQAHARALRLIEQESQARRRAARAPVTRDNTAAVERAHTRAIALIRREEQARRRAVNQAHDEANRIRARERIAVERAHTRALRIIETERRARQRAAVVAARPTTTAAQVDRAHDQALALLRREERAHRRVVDRVHEQANRLRARERIAAERAHSVAIQLLERERAARDRVNQTVVNNTRRAESQRIATIERAHAQAIALIRRERAELERAHAAANRLRARESAAAVVADRRALASLRSRSGAVNDLVRQTALATSAFTGIYSVGFGAIADFFIEPFRRIEAPIQRLQQNLATVRQLSRESLRGGLEGSGQRLAAGFRAADIAIDAATLSILRNERRLNTALGRIQLLFTGTGAAIATASTAIGGAGALLTGGGVFFAATFEREFTNVTKTVDAFQTSLSDLEQRLGSLSQVIPGNVNSLSQIATIAGQLGIEGAENIARFTDVVARLEVSTDLAREEAAFNLARLANRFGTDQFERLGSIIVALGNSLPTTERRILELTTRFAASGRIAGLTADQVLAIASAVSAVGIQSELGGTALQRTFLRLFESISQGGEDLRLFAQIAGQSAEEFRNAFRINPVDAFEGILRGAQENTAVALRNFGELELGGQRLLLTLLSLAGQTGLFAEAVETANRASRTQDALFEESERFYNTFIEQLRQVGSNLRNIAIEFGQVLLPILNATLMGINEIFLRLQSARELGIGQIEALTTSRAELLTRGDRLESAPLEVIRQRQNQILIEAGELRFGALREQLESAQISGNARNIQNAQNRLNRAIELRTGFETELARLAEEIARREAPLTRQPPPPTLAPEFDPDEILRQLQDEFGPRLTIVAHIQLRREQLRDELESVRRDFEQELQFRPGILENLQAVVREAQRDPDSGTFRAATNAIESTRERLAEIAVEESRRRAVVLQLQQRRENELLARHERIAARNERRLQVFRELQSRFPDALESLNIEGLPTTDELIELQRILPSLQRQIDQNEVAMRRLLTLSGDLFSAIIAGGRAGETVLERMSNAARRFFRELLDVALQALLLRPIFENLLRAFPSIGQLLGGGRFGLPTDTGVNPGTAQSGGLRQGFTVVGEAGPELVDFRTASRVYSNERLQELLGGAGRESLVVNFSPVIQSSDGPGVRAALNEALPQFVEAARATMMRDFRRPSTLRTTVGR